MKDKRKFSDISDKKLKEILHIATQKANSEQRKLVEKFDKLRKNR